MKDTDPPSRNERSRKNLRVAVDAKVRTRRPGLVKFEVRLLDISQEGCKVEYVDRPVLGERIWLKVEGLEAIEATICWVGRGAAGAKFGRPLHPAVFDLLVRRLRGSRL